MIWVDSQYVPVGRPGPFLKRQNINSSQLQLKYRTGPSIVPITTATIHRNTWNIAHSRQSIPWVPRLKVQPRSACDMTGQDLYLFTLGNMVMLPSSTQ